MFFEVIGDFELYIFKRNPKNKGPFINLRRNKTRLMSFVIGKLLTTGLRQFTRHPNYFGNATIFWAFYFCALCSSLPLLSVTDSTL